MSAFAEAIARAEGFYVEGSRPARNNNPGDLRAWPGAEEDSDGYAVFDTPERGWAALESQLKVIRDGQSHFYSLSMTFSQMGKIYAGGDPGGNWARNVAAALSAGVDDSIGDYL